MRSITEAALRTGALRRRTSGSGSVSAAGRRMPASVAPAGRRTRAAGGLGRPDGRAGRWGSRRRGRARRACSGGRSSPRSGAASRDAFSCPLLAAAAIEAGMVRHGADFQGGPRGEFANRRFVFRGLPDRAFARCGYQLTGVIGSRPSSTAITFSATSRAMPFRAAWVAEPMWGASTTFSSATSSAAPAARPRRRPVPAAARRPDRRADTRARCQPDRRARC